MSRDGLRHLEHGGGGFRLGAGPSLRRPGGDFLVGATSRAIRLGKGTRDEEDAPNLIAGREGGTGRACAGQFFSFALIVCFCGCYSTRDWRPVFILSVVVQIDC